MDLKLIETGNGGDIVKKSKDFEIIRGFQNMPYLALFGGNPGFSTPVVRPENEQAFDWWGNSLLMPEDVGIQFNSLTENTLNNVPLTSFGASQIEQSVIEDLRFMEEFANISVSVVIVSDDKVCIGIFIEEPENEENKAFVFIWDATEAELSAPIDDGGGVIVKLFIKTPEGNFVLTPEGAKLLFI